MVMVLGQQQTPVHFTAGEAVSELDAAAVREGTPVIDDTGALVALCTLVKGTDGSYVALVPIAPPPADPAPTTSTSTTVADTSTTTSTTVESSSTTTSTTTAPAPSAWAGIRFGDVAPDASPVLTLVAPNGPAATAGMAAGDQIVAVDGKTVTRVDEVLAAIKAKAPGSSIVFTVVGAPPAPTGTAATTTTVAPTTRSVTVVLGVYEPTV
jgi:S1-C subfamily serine protease